MPRIKQRILILGAGVMQGPAMRIASEMGLEVVAADADTEALCMHLADRFEKVDLKDKEGIEALSRSLMEQGGLGGIMTAGTDFSGSVAWAAEKLGLPGIPYDNALDASDKERMRSCFKAAGIPSPEFFIMNKPPAENEELPFPWPAVVKPVDNMGARGCRRVDNSFELKNAVIEALGYSRSNRAIVEEYMEGPEFSVDALVYKGETIICGIADRHICFPPYFIEMGHTMPSMEDPKLIRSLLDIFVRGIKALGITNGAAKGDIKLTPKGPMIGEIAARLSGGYMSGWTYPYSSGVLPTKGAIEIALGRKPSQTKPEWKWTSAERAFISIPGVVRSIEGGEKARAMPWVRNIFMRIRPGSRVVFPENNVSKCGNIISAAAGRRDAITSAENAARSILIRMEAPNDATEAFLAIPFSDKRAVFPPNAFTLDSKLRQLFSILPDNKVKMGDCHLFHLFPFPEFTESGLKDYMGRSVKESLEAVRAITGMELPLGKPRDDTSFLGRLFWQALIRGGYQGAAYYIDSLKAGNE